MPINAAACSSKVLDEKLGKVESELVSDIKCKTLDIDGFMFVYDFDIDLTAIARRDRYYFKIKISHVCSNNNSNQVRFVIFYLVTY